MAQTALSWLEVFVTGLGEENCKQDDRRVPEAAESRPRLRSLRE
jgi:hypothetical protein